MQRIADLAGVAKPVVYRHFANASEALLAVLERRWAEIDADLDAIFRGGVDFEASVAGHVEHYLVGMAQDRYRIRKLLAVADDDPVVFQAWRDRLDRRTRDLARDPGRRRRRRRSALGAPRIVLGYPLHRRAVAAGRQDRRGAGARACPGPPLRPLHRRRHSHAKMEIA